MCTVFNNLWDATGRRANAAQRPAEKPPKPANRVARALLPATSTNSPLASTTPPASAAENSANSPSPSKPPLGFGASRPWGDSERYAAFCRRKGDPKPGLYDAYREAWHLLREK